MKIESFYRSLYKILTLGISIIVGFFVYQKGLITGIPYFYEGNINALNNINSSFSLYSYVNLGEARIQNSWVMGVGIFYLIIDWVGLDPYFFRGLIATIILFIGFTFIRKLVLYFDISKSIIEQLFIAIGFLFSTFTIIFFEDYTVFAYLYWLLPLKLYSIIQLANGNKKWYLVSFFYTLFASMINLPFGLFAEVVGLLLLLGISKAIRSKINFYWFLGGSFLAVLIAIMPMLLYTILNIDYTNYVLASEDFYRANTTIMTYLRGITDWGFFGVYQGSPFRDYSWLYLSGFGLVTFLWIAVPILVVIKGRTLFNSYALALILILSALIIGDAVNYTGWISGLFYSLPLSDIFRNNTKFYFAIYGFVLLLLCLNKNTRIASMVFFIASTPTLYLFLTGGNYSQSKITHSIPLDYIESTISGKVQSSDTVLLFPRQYMPVYNEKNQVKTTLGYSRPEIFWDAKIILDRCMGCGNPLFEKERNILLDPRDKNWNSYLEKYGITKIVYDKNVDYGYYDKTIQPSEFDALMKSQGFTEADKSRVGNIVFYETGIESMPNLTICDAGWYSVSAFQIEPICKGGMLSFERNKNSYYILDFLVILQLVLITGFVITILINQSVGKTKK